MRQAIYLTVPAIALLSACSPSEQSRSSDIQALTVIDGQIDDYRGNTLLTLEQLPDGVRVDGDNEFGAHERFVQAEMSPDGDYIAFTTSGAAHHAGWVYPVNGDTPQPAAFQYGGRVELGPWREDGEYLAFLHQGPAGGTVLSVTATAALSDSVDAANYMVETPNHAQLSPERRDYHVIAWQDQALRFDMGGDEWVYHPGEGVSEY